MDLLTTTAMAVSIMLGSGAQLLLRVAMSGASSGLPQSVAGLLALATSPWLVGGLTSFGMSLVTWLYVLSRLPVSKAYPCVAAGFVITLLAGHFLLGEHIPITRVIGLFIIMTGVLVVACS